MEIYEYVSKDEVRPYEELFEEVFRKIQKELKKKNGLTFSFVLIHHQHPFRIFQSY